VLFCGGGGAGGSVAGGGNTSPNSRGATDPRPRSCSTSTTPLRPASEAVTPSPLAAGPGQDGQPEDGPGGHAGVERLSESIPQEELERLASFAPGGGGGMCGGGDCGGGAVGGGGTAIGADSDTTGRAGGAAAATAAVVLQALPQAVQDKAPAAAASRGAE
jgi:hypothetical protein